VHSVNPLERHAFGGQWTDEKERWEVASWESLLREVHLKDSGRMREKGGKMRIVNPLERHAFGGQCTNEREKWEGA
jgi:hypothetical protein